MTKELIIREPDDFHCHLRDSAGLLPLVLLNTALVFRRALAMGNLNKPDGTPNPVLTASRALEYASDIAQVKAEAGMRDFDALLTMLVTDATTPDMIYEAARKGVVAGKAFAIDAVDPSRAVSFAVHGVSDFGSPMTPVFAAMQEAGMVLCLHGENPQSQTVLDAEKEFLPKLYDLAHRFPRLRIVMEHVSSGFGVEMVNSLPANVAATITVHHLLLTFRDVMGASFSPYNFCKPVAKTEGDRAMLVRAAISGSPKFFLGTDSAPHLIEKKLSPKCPPGIFMTRPLELLAELFEANNALDKLEAFVSEYGARFYRLDRNKGRLILRREPGVITVDRAYAGVLMPFQEGRTLAWSARRELNTR